MRERCTSADHPAFHRYGGRGIVICDRWNDFNKFLEDMGDRPPGMSLDRIDVDGMYEPLNCRWTDIRAQNRNKGNTTKLTHNGKTMSVTEWAEQLGVNRSRLYNRLSNGWSVADTLSERKYRR